MNTDLVIGVSDQATDGSTPCSHDAAARTWQAGGRGAGAGALTRAFGLSSIANVLAPSRWRSTTRGPDDVIVTVATDGHEMYQSELVRYLKRRHNSGELSEVVAAELVGRHLLGADTEHVLDATERERQRIFNLAISPGRTARRYARRFRPAQVADLLARSPRLGAAVDEMIAAFNRDSGMAEAA